MASISSSMYGFDVKLFDKETIDTLPWPQTEEALYAKKYLCPFIKYGTKKYIDNVNADVYALLIDDLVLPVIVTDDNFEDCYSCSTFSFFISYALQSLHIIKNPSMRSLTQNLLSSFGKLVKRGKLNSVVYVNNWLFSTDLHPCDLDAKKLKTILDFLKVRFPKHAISFRSLNGLTTKSLQEETKKLGFKQIATRQVFITDATKESIFLTRIVKSDLKLLKETKFTFVDESSISVDDRSKLLKLYRDLYLEQHSNLNPQFNENYIQLALDQGLLHVRALKDNNNIEGVVGFFDRSGVMMCPFFGYDKTHPENTVLYRLLSTTLLLEAKNRGLMFNQSAGASFYKKTRRAEGVLETMAVYTRHLPLARRVPWLLLQTLINTVGIKAMRNY